MSDNYGLPIKIQREEQTQMEEKTDAGQPQAEEAKAKVAEVVDIQYAELQHIVSAALDAHEQSPVNPQTDVLAGETEAEYVTRQLWLAGYRKA